MVRPARKEKRKKEKASKEREKKKGKVITHGNGVCQSKNYSGCTTVTDVLQIKVHRI